MNVLLFFPYLSSQLFPAQWPWPWWMTKNAWPRRTTLANASCAGITRSVAAHRSDTRCVAQANAAEVL